MRLRVDLRFGYATFDERQADEAWALYRREGVRIRRCRSVGDPGVVLDGAPVEIDFEGRWDPQ